jgi:hypothetical protein
MKTERTGDFWFSAAFRITPRAYRPILDIVEQLLLEAGSHLLVLVHPLTVIIFVGSVSGGIAWLPEASKNCATFQIVIAEVAKVLAFGNQALDGGGMLRELPDEHRPYTLVAARTFMPCFIHGPPSNVVTTVFLIALADL